MTITLSDLYVEKAEAESRRSSYTVSDDSGRSIKVWTDEEPPKVGSELPGLEARVVLNKANTPELIQIRILGRSWMEPPMVYVVLVSAALLIVILGLILSLLRPEHAPAATPALQVLPPLPQPSFPVQVAGGGFPTPGDETVTTMGSSAAPFDDEATLQILPVRACLQNVPDSPSRMRFDLIKTPIFIGRDGKGGRRNDISLRDKTVSREQARIVFDSEWKAFNLINESDSNPTRVNGSPIISHVCQEGDVLEFGTLRLVFSFQS